MTASKPSGLLALAGLALAIAPRVAFAQVVETGEPSAPSSTVVHAPAPVFAPITIDAANTRPRRSDEPVDIHFLSYRGDEHYTVRVRDQQCTTPCTLQLRPGATRLHTTGDTEFDAQFVVPHSEAQVRLAAGAPSWFTTGGAVLLPSGFVVGGAFWAFGLLCGYSSPGCYVLNFAGWPVLGLTMIITGSVLLGMAGRLPPADANRAEILDARARPRLRFTDFAMAPTERGAAAMATFTF